MSIIETALGKIKADSPASAKGPIADRPSVERGNGNLASGLAGRPVLDLPIGRLREVGILPPEVNERRLMAECRTIKRSLLAPLSQRSGEPPLQGGNVVMVASSMPGEGKTFMSFNLAMSLATERDWTTVLVDADVARQHLTASLGLTGKPGLVDVLANAGRSLVDVAYGTAMHNLYIVPAGSSVETATELMASSRMTAMVQDLLRTNPRTILIFDSSPILMTPESRALADAVGQIVFVVKAEATLRSDVEAALKALGAGHRIGVVLNQFQGAASQAYYYGTYGANADSSGADP